MHCIHSCYSSADDDTVILICRRLAKTFVMPNEFAKPKTSQSTGNYASYTPCERENRFTGLEFELLKAVSRYWRRIVTSTLGPARVCGQDPSDVTVGCRAGVPPIEMTALCLRTCSSGGILQRSHHLELFTTRGGVRARSCYDMQEVDTPATASPGGH